MTPLSTPMSARAAIRQVLREHQAQERAQARRCPRCNLPLPEDLPTRLTVGLIGRGFGGRYATTGRKESDLEVNACTCDRTE